MAELGAEPTFAYGEEDASDVHGVDDSPFVLGPVASQVLDEGFVVVQKVIVGVTGGRETDRIRVIEAFDDLHFLGFDPFH